MSTEEIKTPAKKRIKKIDISDDIRAKFTEHARAVHEQYALGWGQDKNCLAAIRTLKEHGVIFPDAKSPQWIHCLQIMALGANASANRQRMLEEGSKAEELIESLENLS